MTSISTLRVADLGFIMLGEVICKGLNRRKCSCARANVSTVRIKDSHCSRTEHCVPFSWLSSISTHTSLSALYSPLLKLWNPMSAGSADASMIPRIQ
ncbi:hypothetical protein SUGI_1086830 [Cryptomeria japonica]|nr:hypothetical protein SUGI_1086830 [Cryptomeria japonica]